VPLTALLFEHIGQPVVEPFTIRPQRPHIGPALLADRCVNAKCCKFVLMKIIMFIIYMNTFNRASICCVCVVGDDDKSVCASAAADTGGRMLSAGER
jgi:hypothetical protein